MTFQRLAALNANQQSDFQSVMQHAHVSGLLVQNAGNYRAFRYIRLARGWKLILPYLSILPSSSWSHLVASGYFTVACRHIQTSSFYIMREIDSDHFAKVAAHWVATRHCPVHLVWDLKKLVDKAMSYANPKNEKQHVRAEMSRKNIAANSMWVPRPFFASSVSMCQAMSSSCYRFLELQRIIRTSGNQRKI